MNLDIIIFDMDGVLMDVSKSYHETIRKTIYIYLKSCLGFKIGLNELVSKEDITLFKSAGGFNNDWDLTSSLLLYLLSISGIPPYSKKERFSSPEGIIQHLKERSSKFSVDVIGFLKRKNLPSFIEKVKSSGGGLEGVNRILDDSWDGWVYRSGDINNENLVKRIFQELYLGNEFKAHYHLKPIFYNGKGLYHKERLIIPKRALSSLRSRVRLGIASGRPRFEAEIALKRFGILSYFDSIVTLDECLNEEKRIYHSTGRHVSLLKPNPYSILRVIKDIGIPKPRCCYIGDVVDDILAAKAIKKRVQMTAIGFLSNNDHRKSLKEAMIRAGADFIAESREGLLRLLS